jgi:xanthine dehydrogenase accessory factor
MNIQLYKQIATIIANRETSWLVTVIGADGSTPGKLGMKMLIKVNGETTGTIGGGTIEKCIIDKTLAEKPCKGESWSFDLGGNFSAVKTGMICGGQQIVFIDPLFISKELYIIGGGHCGQALTELAAKCDFAVTVIDDREEWLTAAKHPCATRLIQANFNDIIKHITFSPDIYIAIMTHGHSLDEIVLRQLIEQEYKYLGIIGSKTKSQIILQYLQQDGYDQQKLQKIFMPIGFKLGTQTPYEIAVGIMAQILAVKSGVNQITFNANPLLLNS